VTGVSGDGRVGDGCVGVQRWGSGVGTVPCNWVSKGCGCAQGRVWRASGCQIMTPFQPTAGEKGRDRKDSRKTEGERERATAAGQPTHCTLSKSPHQQAQFADSHNGAGRRSPFCSSPKRPTHAPSPSPHFLSNPSPAVSGQAAPAAHLGSRISQDRGRQRVAAPALQGAQQAQQVVPRPAVQRLRNGNARAPVATAGEGKWRRVLCSARAGPDGGARPRAGGGVRARSSLPWARVRSYHPCDLTHAAAAFGI
jgi:hypothetical protein